jgi:hypothetical protein
MKSKISYFFGAFFWRWKKHLRDFIDGKQIDAALDIASLKAGTVFGVLMKGHLEGNGTKLLISCLRPHDH